MKKEEVPVPVSPSIRADIHPAVTTEPERDVAARKRYWCGLRRGRLADGTEVECPLNQIDAVVDFPVGEAQHEPTDNPNQVRLTNFKLRGKLHDLSAEQVAAIQKKVGEKILRCFPRTTEKGALEVDARVMNVTLGANLDGKEVLNPQYHRDATRDVPLGRFMFMQEEATLPPNYRQSYTPPAMAD